MKARLLAALLALSVAAGCGQSAVAAGSPDGRLRVVTAFYPLQFLSQRIGGDTVTVTELTKAGAEPHDVELSPRQVGDIVDARLVVYLKGFQPAIDSAVNQEAKGRAYDVGSVVRRLPYDGENGAEREAAAGNTDPHVWLDPVRYATIAGVLGARLAAVDPAHAAGYTERAAQVQAELATLNTEFADGLRTCARHEIVTSHAAFHYLAERYRLTEVGITGISPEAEPSPRRLAEIADTARATGTTTIFFETLVSPKIAETLAREIGARAAVLDPLEGLTTPHADYFSVMRDNLAALTLALGCA
jgi:zinc transport system substrate-binding protein